MFASGEPWTHTFWSGLFYTLMIGVVLAMLTISRSCPRCGAGFFVSRNYRRRTSATARGSVNFFARQCVNCKLSLF